jgi:C-terminal processing protease CtpA/Prc
LIVANIIEIAACMKIPAISRFAAAVVAGLALITVPGLKADIPPPYERYGIGATLTEAEPYPVISDVIKGGAADKAGIVNGDAIIAVDGDYARGGVPFYYLAGMLAGRQGTEVELVVLHERRLVRVVKVKRLHRK